MNVREIPLVFIPECGAGKGTGHIKRSLGFAAGCKAYFFVPKPRQEAVLKAFPELGNHKILSSLKDFSALQEALVIFDKPWINTDEALEASLAWRVLAFDPRGPGMEYIPWVIDILPRLKSKNPARGFKPNCCLPQLLFASDIPRRQRTAGRELRIALSFGGEDPAQLRKTFAESGLLQKLVPRAQVDIIRGPLSPVLGLNLPATWREIGPLPNLSHELHQYDLLICSFGLTAFEARHAGIAQIHLNPTAYHDRLSRQEGFLSLGVLKPGKEAFRVFENCLKNLYKPDNNSSEFEESKSRYSFETLLEDLASGSGHSCPACRSRGNPVIFRSSTRSFFRCGTCGMEYQELAQAQTIQYSQDYFGLEYQKQYGKTYLEDFEQIKAYGYERLDQLKQLRIPAHGSLLDIGCAYGPFLAAAASRGYQVQGCDINPQAIDYVRHTLGYKAWALNFMDETQALEGAPFETVSLWYVIEHFEELFKVLKRLNHLLKPGGILAFSTPSAEGISARRSAEKFYTASPMDHYSLWRPSKTEQVLKKYGFKVLKIRSTGHHPERFSRFWASPRLQGFTRSLSSLLKLGDTFEVYAKKVDEIHED